MRLSLRLAAATLSVLLPLSLLSADALGAQAAHRPENVEVVAGFLRLAARGGLHTTLLFGAAPASNPLWGQLWRTDGSSGGVAPIGAFDSGEAPREFSPLGSSLLFASSNALWMSDGTEAGTVHLRDFPFNATHANPRELTSIGDGVLFAAIDGQESAYQLWKSDGTPEGTTEVAPLFSGLQASGPFSLTRVGDVVYFFSTDSTGGLLWRSDGTAAGTAQVAPLEAGRSPSSLTMADSGLIYFVTQQGQGADPVTYSLFRSDGTAGGTSLVRDFAVDYPPVCPGNVCVPSGPTGITPLRGDTVLFVANDGTSGRQLWSSDGTAAGTVPVVPSSGPILPGSLARFRDRVYFDAFDLEHGNELWRTDGTGAGTALFVDTDPGRSYGDPTALTVFHDRLFFEARGEFPYSRLWVSDGTVAGTVPIQDVSVRDDGYGFFTATDDALYFDGSAPDADGLWKTDGTEAGTLLVSDLSGPPRVVEPPANARGATRTLSSRP